MLEQGAVPPMAEAVEAARDYLRLDESGDDALIAGLIAGAVERCEATIGTVLIARATRETVAISSAWRTLGDLKVQTSRYGSAIPQIFGRVRVAGTVIWSTDLIETRSTQSSGKGGTRTNSYSYSASFAVLLSGRMAGRIGRIWADGNLLRGNAGDFKTATRFRWLDGSGDQALDPLIAAAEGLATTPAYRGRAVAVFEDFQLAAYGNRIPSLSFEVIADEGPVAVGTLLSTLSAGAIADGGGALIDGIAVTGDSVRGVAATLAEALPMALRDTGATLALVGDNAAVRALALADEGASASDATAATTESRMAADRLPTTLSLTYYDAARDYQAGVQRAQRGGGGRGATQIALAATIGSAAAKAMAEAQLATAWRERRSLSVALPWRAIDVRPGDVVTLAGATTLWRVSAVSFEKMVVRLALVPDRVGSQRAMAADPGRNVAQADVAHGPTTLFVIDLPPIDDVAQTAPRVVVAANGASPGWRRAALMGSSDAGTTFIEMGATALPATIGRTLGTLVRVRAVRGSDGAIETRWTRRSREGGRWDDGVDAPLGEEREAYRLTRIAPGSPPLIVDLSVACWTYSTTQIATDRAAGATSATLSIVQIGSRRESQPASITVALA